MADKEKYEAPSAEIISFSDADIITASETKLPPINGAGVPDMPSLF